MIGKIFNWWVLSVLTAVFFALCLTVLAPIFVASFQPLLVRVALLGLVILIWGGFATVRLVLARQASSAIAKELARPEPGDAEVAAVARRMAQALESLKKASGGRRDYLYSRPWYVIIGPPGAGKTTALVNSGLKFPYSDTALKGVGGTRNLDFWFADQAALVDTAGRYTTQDSDAAADAAAWKGFLNVLRRRRPLQPINGVIVALGMDVLLGADRRTLDAHAAAVRRRLAEVAAILELSAPVYVMFTKADLLAGFAEFFEDLDAGGRRAVLGATLDRGRALNALALAEAFDVVSQSLSDRRAKRLQDEPDLRRRSLILGFPAQFGALRARALRFLDAIFLGDDRVGALRGFYLTSGVQGGAPLDRLLEGVAGAFDRPTEATGAGRAYFLNRLLTEVMIPEAGLVQEDPASVRRRRLSLLAGMASISTVCILILVLWSVSFLKNNALQSDMAAKATTVSSEIRSTGIDTTEVKRTDPSMGDTLAALRDLRNLPGGYGDQAHAGPPLTARFGLYQGGLANHAREAYLEGLRRILLPRLMFELEDFMTQHAGDAAALYDPLKVYQLLGDAAPPYAEGRSGKDAVAQWFAADWAQNVLPGADHEEDRKELAEHLKALLGNTPNKSWADRRAPLDPKLIDTTRMAVERLPLPERAYEMLKAKAEETGKQPWSAAPVISSAASQAFANPAEVQALTVPYMFTKAGYQNFYRTELKNVEKDLNDDGWMFGPDAKTGSILSQMGEIQHGIAERYAQDYIKAWNSVMAALKPADYFHNGAALSALTNDPSPLTDILNQVRDNTNVSDALPGLSKLHGAKAAESLVSGGGAAEQITGAFQLLRTYLGSGPNGPLAKFLAELNAAVVSHAAADVAAGTPDGGSLQTELIAKTAALKRASDDAPPALKAFVASAADSGAKEQVTSGEKEISEAYRHDVLPTCQSVVTNHYPFTASSRNDASAREINALFGQGGLFDTFRRDHLGSLLARGGPTWRWDSQYPVGASLEHNSPLSAEGFQRASEIGDLIGDGLLLKVSADGFRGTVTSVEIDNDGRSYRFEGASAAPQNLKWVPQSFETRVILYAGTTPVRTFAEEGAFALFRIMDQARIENAGPSFKATLGEGVNTATLRITLNTERNPFKHSGVWSFLCPNL